MKSFLRLAGLALLCVSAAHASATPLDFKMNVLDPPPFPTNPITQTPFAVSFVPCVQGELPGGLTADGCFSGVNRSGFDWNDLQLVFDNNSALHAQPPSCNTTQTDAIFGSTRCGFDTQSQQYTLLFTNGVLRDGQFFFITEEGVIPPESFGTGTATVLSETAAVAPEPASFILVASGFGVSLLTWRLQR